MNKPEPVSTRDRVAKRRAALRAQGLRLKQMWVPDLRDPEVRREIDGACKRIATSPRHQEDIAFMESLQYWPLDDRD
jgi:hypothetical protein